MEKNISVRFELLSNFLLLAPQSFHITSNADWFHFIDYTNLRTIDAGKLNVSIDYSHLLKEVALLNRYGDISKHHEDGWLVEFGGKIPHPVVSKLGFTSEIDYEKNIKAVLFVSYNVEAKTFELTHTKKIKNIRGRWDAISNSRTIFHETDHEEINQFVWSYIEPYVNKTTK
jgi:hypothetical protein